MLIAGLSTEHKIGLLVMAGIFIGFSLWSSFLAPRRWPDYPGRAMSVFIFASVVLFAGMLTAVWVFGVEEEEATASEGAGAAEGAAAGKTIQVSEVEYKIKLPSSTPTKLPGGRYTFDVSNDGQQAHDLVIVGPGVAHERTPILQAGKSAKLTVTLESGTYDLYCSIPGHKQLGMDDKLTVGS
ncbi:MAG TPA: plastocyanin/azurin family copper-binding protein [Gaiellaceae bacterium]